LDLRILRRLRAYRQAVLPVQYQLVRVRLRLLAYKPLVQ
jgi:hypothetical protein